MLVKILLLLLIILIALFLVIFSESLHVYVQFNYMDNSVDGQITISYYFINYIKDFNNNITKLAISTRFFSKEFFFNNEKTESELTHEKIPVSNEKNNNELSEDISNVNKNNILDLIRQYYPEIMALKHDIFDIIISIKDIFFIDENYLNINLGLKDNNLTIKVCTFFWSLAAIFYPIGLNIIVKPIINDIKIEIQSNLHFNISLLSILKLLFKIICNVRLVKLLISVYKEMN